MLPPIKISKRHWAHIILWKTRPLSSVLVIKPLFHCWKILCIQWIYSTAWNLLHQTLNPIHAFNKIYQWSIPEFLFQNHYPFWRASHIKRFCLIKIVTWFKEQVLTIFCVIELMKQKGWKLHQLMLITFIKPCTHCSFLQYLHLSLKHTQWPIFSWVKKSQFYVYWQFADKCERSISSTWLGKKWLVTCSVCVYSNDEIKLCNDIYVCDSKHKWH